MVRKLLLSLKEITNHNGVTETRLQVEEKFLLIIKARWVVFALLFIYGLFSYFTYLSRLENPEIINIVIWSFSLLLLAAIFNFINHFAWHKYHHFWGNKVTQFIRTQIIVDIFAVTLLIYGTGGITSWFWALYILLIIEHVELSNNQNDVILTGSLIIVFYSALIFAQYFKVLLPIKMPFELYRLSNELSYVLIVWFWVCLLNIAAVYMASFLHKKDQLAIKDGLTGLYNRRFFEHILKSEIERAKRFNHTLSLLMIDIDDFKFHNDSYGHQQGDNVLRLVGNILNNNIRRSEEKPTYDIDIACRYGGEEFAVILPETGAQQSMGEKIQHQINGAYILAEKLRKQIAFESKITVSIGVATYSYQCKDYYNLIEEADKALYKAKSLGKNKVVVAPTCFDTEEEVQGIVGVARDKKSKSQKQVK